MGSDSTMMHTYIARLVPSHMPDCTKYGVCMRGKADLHEPMQCIQGLSRIAGSPPCRPNR